MPLALTHISSLLVPSSPSPPSSLRPPSSSLSSPSSSSSAIVTTTTTLPTRTIKLPFHTPCACSLPTFLPQMPPERHQRNNPPGYVSTNRSSEFLYLGALVNSTVDPEQLILSSNGGSKLGDPSSPYQKLGSLKLNPLPPMPEVQTLQNVEQFLQYEQMGSFENDVKEKKYLPNEEY
ncbi:hypothetical protein PVK06_001261 [Gossypium arboreum]|uniref:Uncharacterized protein n=1 Tax=Gossypium arboreum TaxID=29729 RepID=A0ABR0R1V5_GOSAR|nr:hypothetical protein PVK06_001261 [Gossypium arboreum]